ncbi:hypothetical protein T08_1335 [Trichinella sp. T8]|nr:hypothetical protein T08_1335 [Trichinella sp. T8]
MPKKPAKYGIKFWVACCSKSSYAWNMQIYTGKPSSGTREKNQGMRVVLDMVKGLKARATKGTAATTRQKIELFNICLF